MGTYLAVLDEAVGLLAKEHLLGCDCKPTDTHKQGLTLTSWNVLPTAYCLEIKVTPVWHKALPCRDIRAGSGAARPEVGQEQGQRYVLAAHPPLRSAV